MRSSSPPTPPGTVIRDGAVAVSGGRIARIGPAAEIGREAREVVDAARHAPDARARQHPLPWRPTACSAASSRICRSSRGCSRSGRPRAAILTRETVRLGATLGFAELLLGGVTTVMDMFWHPRETRGRGARRRLPRRDRRHLLRRPGRSTGGRPAERLAEAEAFFEEFAGAEDVLPGCFPHGAYTVGPDELAAAKRLAAERGGLFSTHAAETRAEQATVTARYGRSVIRHLDDLGLLDARTVLAHCVWLDDEEIAILARTGASVAHNPMSNLKLASGIARVPDMLAAGVRVTLGTDGAISGNDLDMWMALRLAATLHRGATPRRDGGDDGAGAADGDARRGGGARGGGPAGLARGRASSPT